MNSTTYGALILAVVMASSAQAATIRGTVANKTTGRPSAGDKVALVDLSAGMGDAATAITDTAGQYVLQASGSGPYLIRVDHQGAGYFIAAPQQGIPGDITVYDVAARVDGVGIDADMLLIEAGRGTLHVRERYLIRNVSSPPRTQFGENSFKIVLPEDAELEEAASTRPGGMGTRTHLIPLAEKGHYAFNVPIQPNLGEKETMFEVAYHFPYNGQHTFSVHPIAPADHFVVYTAKGIEFTPKNPSLFKVAQEDTRVDTHVAMNVHPGDEISFTLTGEGQMPPDAGNNSMQLSGPAATAGGPGGGTSASIPSQNALTGFKGWLLGGYAVLLTGIVLVVLRRKNQTSAASVATLEMPSQVVGSVHPSTPFANSRADSTAAPKGSLLDSLKEELFLLEQDKISGRVSPEEYLHAKAGLEAVLKRALNATSG